MQLQISLQSVYVAYTPFALVTAISFLIAYKVLRKSYLLFWGTATLSWMGVIAGISIQPIYFSIGTLCVQLSLLIHFIFTSATIVVKYSINPGKDRNLIVLLVILTASVITDSILMSTPLISTIILHTSFLLYYGRAILLAGAYTGGTKVKTAAFANLPHYLYLLPWIAQLLSILLDGFSFSYSLPTGYSIGLAVVAPIFAGIMSIWQIAEITTSQKQSLIEAEKSFHLARDEAAATRFLTINSSEITRIFERVKTTSELIDESQSERVNPDILTKMTHYIRQIDELLEEGIKDNTEITMVNPRVGSYRLGDIITHTHEQLSSSAHGSNIKYVTDNYGTILQCSLKYLIIILSSIAEIIDESIFEGAYTELGLQIEEKNNRFFVTIKYEMLHDIRISKIQSDLQLKKQAWLRDFIQGNYGGNVEATSPNEQSLQFSFKRVSE
jgi:uncharacterized protein YqgV (UPF0045/DUF77 family)